MSRLKPNEVVNHLITTTDASYLADKETINAFAVLTEHLTGEVLGQVNIIESNGLTRFSIAMHED